MVLRFLAKVFAHVAERIGMKQHLAIAVDNRESVSRRQNGANDRHRTKHEDLDRDTVEGRSRLTLRPPVEGSRKNGSEFIGVRGKNGLEIRTILQVLMRSGKTGFRTAF